MNIDTERSYCPLCGDQLVDLGGEVGIEFPTAIAKGKMGKRGFMSKLFFALSTLVAVICVIINMATYKLAPIRWSVVASMGIFYSWYLVSRCIIKRGNATKVLFRQLVTISILLFSIDAFLTDYAFWSLCYAVPFLSISINIAIVIIALANMLYFRDHLHYSTLTFACGALQIIWLFFMPVKWAIIASVAVSITAFVIIGVVAQKNLSGELKKRLHL